MPRYDFRCNACGMLEEVTRPMANAGDPAHCSICGTEMVRIFFAPSIQYKCDGFHQTDYGSGVGTGTKADALNRAWSKHYGEAPPPPATDVDPNKKS